MSPRPKFAALALGLAASVFAADSLAFIFGPQPPAMIDVVEYFNTSIGHYFYSANPGEIAAIDAGAAGPGWQKTGLLFSAYKSIAASGNESFPTCDKGPSPCVPVSRFYGTPGLGPNSHFYTANPIEAAGLMKPGTGWTFEETAFVLPVPDAATGQCPQGTAAVHRFYNDRANQNDSNHRYTTSAETSALMRAAGWIDEGIAFCAYSHGTSALELHEVAIADTSELLQAPVCDREANAGRSCFAFSNLPVPFVTYPAAAASFPDQLADAFAGKTMVNTMGTLPFTANIALPAESRDAAAKDVFVQLVRDFPDVFGLHLSTLSKGGLPYSSITPMKRLAAEAGGVDRRLFAYAPRYATSYELRFTFEMGARPITLEPGSAGYGVGTIEFQDRESQLRVRLNMLAYGTAAAAEFAARDPEGVVIVGTSFRQGTPYGRSFGSGVQVPGRPPPAIGDVRGTYAWFMKREEFARALAAARGIDSRLSADPANYFVRSFGVINEIAGSGEMSAVLLSIRLALAPVFEP